MADDKLQGLLNLRETAQRFMTNPTAFLGLLGQNPLPRESGFAAGATGLPPTEMSVLDPNQAPYMQGYGQGEPVGIAAMALPFAAPAAVMAGKALAPKAGQALESYMVNQGLLQPIMTYHASPYKFDRFDPTKVGTGEGAQSYGVGAGYVAQNPKVANEYFKQFTDVEQIPLMYKGKRVDTPWNDEISQRWADVIEKNKFNQEQIVMSLETYLGKTALWYKLFTASGNGADYYIEDIRNNFPQQFLYYAIGTLELDAPHEMRKTVIQLDGLNVGQWLAAVKTHFGDEYYNQMIESLSEGNSSKHWEYQWWSVYARIFNDGNGLL
jgi:hypothetical protein